MKKYISITTLLLLSTHSLYAYSCIGEDYSQWNNCNASYTWGDGDQYEGRWENGRMNGFGKYVFADDNTWSVKTYEGFYIC